MNFLEQKPHQHLIVVAAAAFTRNVGRNRSPGISVVVLWCWTFPLLNNARGMVLILCRAFPLCNHVCGTGNANLNPTHGCAGSVQTLARFDRSALSLLASSRGSRWQPSFYASQTCSSWTVRCRTSLHQSVPPPSLVCFSSSTPNARSLGCSLDALSKGEASR